MKFHVSTVLKGETEKNDADEVAKNLFSVCCITLSEFVSGKGSVLASGSIHELMFDVINSHDFWTGDTFFENFDKLVFVIIVMRDNFGLNRSQKEKHRDIDGWDEECDDENGIFICGDKENCCYKND